MYYFIGIKGSGMASLACILSDLGNEVSGSDIDKHVFIEKHLENRNIPFYTFNENNIKDGMNVIIGNAFDDTNPEVRAAKANSKVKTYTYPEFLGKLVDDYSSVCVVGTHGKTNTTGLMAHVLDANDQTGYLVGDGTGYMPKDAKYFVLEACEYYRRFLNYYPDYAIILNIELDHVDYYNGIDDYISAFQSFTDNVKKGIALFGDDDNVRSLKVKTPHLYYGLNDNDDVQARNVDENPNGVSFDCYIKGEFFHHFDLAFYGIHILWNILGVITIGYMNGMSAEGIDNALHSFKGTERRFIVEENGDNIYIDDYAHHPTAIRVTIAAAKQKYPNKKIVALFKPDRYSRIAYFMDQFNDAFKEADKVYLCPFPANAAKEEGIDIDIYDLQKHVEGSEVISEIQENIPKLAAEGPAVYLFMSSKDIYKFKDLLKVFQKN